MHYTTFFDVSQNWPSGWIGPLGAAALGAFLGWKALRSESEDRENAKMFVWAGAALLLALMMLMTIAFEYRDNRNELASGDYQTVEGQIAHFREGPKSTSFDVAGVGFEYSSYRLTSAYNGSYFGPDTLQDGMQVRIAYDRKGKILKLEIAW